MKPKRKCWTNEECLILQTKYEIEGLGWEEIVPFLANRSLTAIHIKCKKMGLRHTRAQKTKLRSRIHSGENNGMYGKPSPWRGLTKSTSNFISKRADSQSKAIQTMILEGKHWGAGNGNQNPMYGKSPWNQGRTKITNKSIAAGAEKQSVVMKQLWKNLPEPEKEKRRILWASQAKKCKKQRTSIEIIVENWLKEQHVDFEGGAPLGRWHVDFYIPSLSKVVECDGDYWHCNPLKYNSAQVNNIQRKNMDRDARKKIFLASQGIKLINLWESNIRDGSAKDNLIQFLQQ